MPSLIIASISPRAGKTAVAATLAVRHSSQGRKVHLARAWSADDESEQSLALLAPGATVSDPAPAGSPAREVAAAIRKAAGGADVSIIEGTSADAAANMALAEALDGLVVVVGVYGEDLAAEAARYGSRLAGTILNRVPRYRVHEATESIIPALAQSGAKPLGWLPEDRRLIAPTLAAVAKHLDGEYLFGEDLGDRLLDNFLIGGLILDWGPFYFGSQQNVGVVVRGDRPDVQLAALQTETVRAMVLTKGVPPVEYVQYEAEQKQIPLVTVQGETSVVAERLQSMELFTPFNHPDKVVRLAELLEEHVDMAALDDAVALPATR
jgi:BioD-like phosphotransacetylase family protein